MQVKTCGFPPLEDREKSFSTFAGIDFYGGGSLTKEETVSFENVVTNLHTPKSLKGKYPFENP